MTQQLLKRPQIGTARKKMRRKAVPERMGRESIGQTQPPPRSGNGAPH